MSDAILSTKDLEVSYGGSRILRQATLEIPRGAIAAVMGRNGMGKTTLLKALMGLLQPDQGYIIFEDEDITEVSPDRRARLGLGYVPQGREIFPKLTVMENLRVGLEACTRRQSQVPEEMVYDLFPILSEMRHRQGGNLSGGQQQQLAIARALVGEPKVLLLDEPTEGIQPSIIQEIEKVLIRLKEETEMTIVLVEQYFDFARQIADCFFLMDRGSIPLSGSGEELSDESIKEYLTF